MLWLLCSLLSGAEVGHLSLGWLAFSEVLCLHMCSDHHPGGCLAKPQGESSGIKGPCGFVQLGGPRGRGCSYRWRLRRWPLCARGGQLQWELWAGEQGALVLSTVGFRPHLGHLKAVLRAVESHCSLG